MKKMEHCWHCSNNNNNSNSSSSYMSKMEWTLCSMERKDVVLYKDDCLFHKNYGNHSNSYTHNFQPNRDQRQSNVSGQQEVQSQKHHSFYHNKLLNNYNWSNLALFPQCRHSNVRITMMVVIIINNTHSCQTFTERYFILHATMHTHSWCPNRLYSTHQFDETQT